MGRIDSAGSLGVFATDPTTHGTKTVNTLSQTVDARTEVQEGEGDADGELRVRGLPDQPSDWEPFSLPSGHRLATVLAGAVVRPTGR